MAEHLDIQDLGQPSGPPTTRPLRLQCRISDDLVDFDTSPRYALLASAHRATLFYAQSSAVVRSLDFRAAILRVVLAPTDVFACIITDDAVAYLIDLQLPLAAEPVYNAVDLIASAQAGRPIAAIASARRGLLFLPKELPRRISKATISFAGTETPEFLVGFVPCTGDTILGRSLLYFRSLDLLVTYRLRNTFAIVRYSPVGLSVVGDTAGFIYLLATSADLTLVIQDVCSSDADAPALFELGQVYPEPPVSLHILTPRSILLAYADGLMLEYDAFNRQIVKHEIVGISPGMEGSNELVSRQHERVFQSIRGVPPRDHDAITREARSRFSRISPSESLTHQAIFQESLYRESLMDATNVVVDEVRGRTIGEAGTTYPGALDILPYASRRVGVVHDHTFVRGFGSSQVVVVDHYLILFVVVHGYLLAYNLTAYPNSYPPPIFVAYIPRMGITVTETAAVRVANRDVDTKSRTRQFSHMKLRLHGHRLILSTRNALHTLSLPQFLLPLSEYRISVVAPQILHHIPRISKDDLLHNVQELAAELLHSKDGRRCGSRMIRSQSAPLDRVPHSPSHQKPRARSAQRSMPLHPEDIVAIDAHIQQAKERYIRERVLSRILSRIEYGHQPPGTFIQVPNPHSDSPAAVVSDAAPRSNLPLQGRGNQGKYPHSFSASTSSDGSDKDNDHVEYTSSLQLRARRSARMASTAPERQSCPSERSIVHPLHVREASNISAIGSVSSLCPEVQLPPDQLDESSGASHIQSMEVLVQPEPEESVLPSRLYHNSLHGFPRISAPGMRSFDASLGDLLDFILTPSRGSSPTQNVLPSPSQPLCASSPSVAFGALLVGKGAPNIRRVVELRRASRLLQGNARAAHVASDLMTVLQLSRTGERVKTTQRIPVTDAEDVLASGFFTADEQLEIRGALYRCPGRPSDVLAASTGVRPRRKSAYFARPERNETSSLTAQYLPNSFGSHPTSSRRPTTKETVSAGSGPEVQPLPVPSTASPTRTDSRQLDFRSGDFISQRPFAPHKAISPKQVRPAPRIVMKPVAALEESPENVYPLAIEPKEQDVQPSPRDTRSSRARPSSSVPVFTSSVVFEDLEELFPPEQMGSGRPSTQSQPQPHSTSALRRQSHTEAAPVERKAKSVMGTRKEPLTRQPTHHEWLKSRAKSSDNVRITVFSGIPKYYNRQTHIIYPHQNAKEERSPQLNPRYISFAKALPRPSSAEDVVPRQHGVHGGKDRRTTTPETPKRDSTRALRLEAPTATSQEPECSNIDMFSQLHKAFDAIDALEFAEADRSLIHRYTQTISSIIGGQEYAPERPALLVRSLPPTTLAKLTTAIGSLVYNLSVSSAASDDVSVERPAPGALRAALDELNRAFPSMIAVQPESRGSEASHLPRSTFDTGSYQSFTTLPQRKSLIARSSTLNTPAKGLSRQSTQSYMASLPSQRPSENIFSLKDVLNVFSNLGVHVDASGAILPMELERRQKRRHRVEVPCGLADVEDASDDEANVYTCQVKELTMSALNTPSPERKEPRTRRDPAQRSKRLHDQYVVKRHLSSAEYLPPRRELRQLSEKYAAIYHYPFGEGSPGRQSPLLRVSKCDEPPAPQASSISTHHYDRSVSLVQSVLTDLDLLPQAQSFETSIEGYRYTIGQADLTRMLLATSEQSESHSAQAIMALLPESMREDEVFVQSLSDFLGERLVAIRENQVQLGRLFHSRRHGYPERKTPVRCRITGNDEDIRVHKKEQRHSQDREQWSQEQLTKPSLEASQDELEESQVLRAPSPIQDVSELSIISPRKISQGRCRAQDTCRTASPGTDILITPSALASGHFQHKPTKKAISIEPTTKIRQPVTNFSIIQTEESPKQVSAQSAHIKVFMPNVTRQQPDDISIQSARTSEVSGPSTHSFRLFSATHDRIRPRSALAIQELTFDDTRTIPPEVAGSVSRLRSASRGWSSRLSSARTENILGNDSESDSGLPMASSQRSLTSSHLTISLVDFGTPSPVRHIRHDPDKLDFQRVVSARRPGSGRLAVSFVNQVTQSPLRHPSPMTSPLKPTSEITEFNESQCPSTAQALRLEQSLIADAPATDMTQDSLELPTPDLRFLERDQALVKSCVARDPYRLRSARGTSGLSTSPSGIPLRTQRRMNSASKHSDLVETSAGSQPSGHYTGLQKRYRYGTLTPEEGFPAHPGRSRSCLGLRRHVHDGYMSVLQVVLHDFTYQGSSLESSRPTIRETVWKMIQAATDASASPQKAREVHGRSMSRLLAPLPSTLPYPQFASYISPPPQIQISPGLFFSKASPVPASISYIPESNTSAYSRVSMTAESATRPGSGRSSKLAAVISGDPVFQQHDEEFQAQQLLNIASAGSPLSGFLYRDTLRLIHSAYYDSSGAYTYAEAQARSTGLRLHATSMFYNLPACFRASCIFGHTAIDKDPPSQLVAVEDARFWQLEDKASPLEHLAFAVNMDTPFVGDINASTDSPFSDSKDVSDLAISAIIFPSGRTQLVRYIPSSLAHSADASEGYESQLTALQRVVSQSVRVLLLSPRSKSAQHCTYTRTRRPHRPTSPHGGQRTNRWTLKLYQLEAELQRVDRFGVRSLPRTLIDDCSPGFLAQHWLNTIGRHCQSRSQRPFLMQTGQNVALSRFRQRKGSFVTTFEGTPYIPTARPHYILLRHEIELLHTPYYLERCVSDDELMHKGIYEHRHNPDSAKDLAYACEESLSLVTHKVDLLCSLVPSVMNLPLTTKPNEEASVLANEQHICEELERTEVAPAELQLEVFPEGLQIFKYTPFTTIVEGSFLLLAHERIWSFTTSWDRILASPNGMVPSVAQASAIVLEEKGERVKRTPSFTLPTDVEAHLFETGYERYKRNVWQRKKQQIQTMYQLSWEAVEKMSRRRIRKLLRQQKSIGKVRGSFLMERRSSNPSTLTPFSPDEDESRILMFGNPRGYEADMSGQRDGRVYSLDIHAIIAQHRRASTPGSYRPSSAGPSISSIHDESFATVTPLQPRTARVHVIRDPPTEIMPGNSFLLPSRRIPAYGLQLLLLQEVEKLQLGLRRVFRPDTFLFRVLAYFERYFVATVSSATSSLVESERLVPTAGFAHCVYGGAAPPAKYSVVERKGDFEPLYCARDATRAIFTPIFAIDQRGFLMKLRAIDAHFTDIGTEIRVHMEQEYANKLQAVSQKLLTEAREHSDEECDIHDLINRVFFHTRHSLALDAVLRYSTASENIFMKNGCDFDLFMEATLDNNYALHPELEPLLQQYRVQRHNRERLVQEELERLRLLIQTILGGWRSKGLAYNLAGLQLIEAMKSPLYQRAIRLFLPVPGDEEDDSLGEHDLVDDQYRVRHMFLSRLNLIEFSARLFERQYRDGLVGRITLNPEGLRRVLDVVSQGSRALPLARAALCCLNEGRSTIGFYDYGKRPESPKKVSATRHAMHSPEFAVHALVSLVSALPVSSPSMDLVQNDLPGPVEPDTPPQPTIIARDALERDDLVVFQHDLEKRMEAVETGELDKFDVLTRTETSTDTLFTTATEVTSESDIVADPSTTATTVRTGRSKRVISEQVRRRGAARAADTLRSQGHIVPSKDKDLQRVFAKLVHAGTGEQKRPERSEASRLDSSLTQNVVRPVLKPLSAQVAAKSIPRIPGRLVPPPRHAPQIKLSNVSLDSSILSRSSSSMLEDLPQEHSGGQAHLRKRPQGSYSQQNHDVATRYQPPGALMLSGKSIAPRSSIPDRSMSMYSSSTRLSSATGTRGSQRKSANSRRSSISSSEELPTPNLPHSVVQPRRPVTTGQTHMLLTDDDLKSIEQLGRRAITASNNSTWTVIGGIARPGSGIGIKSRSTRNH
ncbi:hypothetical protein GMRT_13925 [Giardia muris]|uniref:Uncharacterized protein n=1 Tax=Giardia muris TaxID=5742 RepID=A0A4Z1T251_GIAMU|nr:hypothetical protein GMRT_13925 [Giardia muris]|eukprot:TNJ26491.1 hypothetical protein GMRT_13925 [Giardia muris]